MLVFIGDPESVKVLELWWQAGEGNRGWWVAERRKRVATYGTYGFYIQRLELNSLMILNTTMFEVPTSDCDSSVKDHPGSPVIHAQR